MDSITSSHEWHLAPGSLELRRIGALDKLRLFKAVGPSLAQNEPYLGMALLAFAVAAIDGVPVPSPVNEAQIESLVARLGDSGLAAIGDAMTGVQLGGALDDEGTAAAGN